ncbi:NUDIX domain-containing protein [Mycoplasmatota bacterium]|nr:NUDIX domain-containing protein [Mycoplasmatota bacterium]
MDNIWFIVNVEAAIYQGDKWLVIKRGMKETHAKGLLSLVGGKVENASVEADVLEKTIKREILEEVGIEIKDDIEYLESKAFVTDEGNAVVDVVFLCQYKALEARVIDSNEVEKVYWKTKDEILSDDKAPIYLKEIIIKADKLRINNKRDWL